MAIKTTATFIVDQFVLDQVFNKHTKITTGEVIYWRSVADAGNGYIVLFENGEHLHTYHNPPDWI
jgi:hypothetical protein